MTELQTINLILRPCTPSDRVDFIALERDPAVMRYLNGGQAVSNEEGDPDSSFLMPRGTEPYVWTARRKVNGAFVGWFCLYPDSERVAELGYRVRAEEWGQGLAAEGAAALVEWGFEGGQFDTVFASTMAVNLASRRVMEKIGMRYVRTFYLDWETPIAGSEEGEVVYEVRRAV